MKINKVSSDSHGSSYLLSKQELDMLNATGMSFPDMQDISRTITMFWEI